jgi:uncharacterized phage protein (TIGR01671 family)
MEIAIKFRGKLNSNREWIYGLPSYDLQYIFNDENLDSPDNFEVNSKTIGQFAGLKDKSDIELFEGDLFKCETNDIIYRVWKVAGGFAINTHVKVWQKDIKRDYPFPLIPLADEQTASWFQSSCNIVGNIFDNPELINEAT